MSSPTSLNIAIQMDPPKGINPEKDSTYALGLEAQKRGHTLTYYNADSLSLKNGILTANCAALTFHDDKTNHCDLGSFSHKDLREFDIILMRNDFNDPMSYTAMTHMLDHLKTKTLVLNDPTGTRESPEKMLITHFPDLAPKTLITRDLDAIKAFASELGDLIIKPLNGFGGMGVYHITEDDDNLSSVYEMLCALHTEPFVVQQYIPEIKKGDKRIIVVEGEPIAAILRVPPQKSARANLAVGGTAEIGDITDRDRQICARLKPELVKRGLVFVGLDVIGDYVTEINPKSPTGLQHITKMQNIKCEETIWGAYEARYKAFKNAA
ncbi:MAG: glutathione synthase [Alphaproteobacteria bacterium]|nr:glutathione synthase [Alphaproteobacteria bacterium]